MTEFANYTSSKMPNGFSARGGQVYSAYGKAGDPSGSSTGSAVAVSAGFARRQSGRTPLFLWPAVRRKTAHGSLSGRGIVPIASLLDSAGLPAHTFADAVWSTAPCVRRRLNHCMRPKRDGCVWRSTPFGRKRFLKYRRRCFGACWMCLSGRSYIRISRCRRTRYAVRSGMVWRITWPEQMRRTACWGRSWRSMGEDSAQMPYGIDPLRTEAVSRTQLIRAPHLWNLCAALMPA
ncbi:MAG: hypothetical protein ACLT3G_02850 [Acutalibacteraceae bacterium]